MSTIAAALTARPMTARLHLVTRWIAIAVLAWVLLSVARFLFADGPMPSVGGWRPILAAAGCYLLGHVMRIVRLALLVGNARLSLRRLAAFHLFTAGVSLGAPWRLGDAYRAVELADVTGRLGTGFTFVWIERLFDAAVLLPVLTVVLFFSITRGSADTVSNYAAVTVFTLIFVLASVLAVALLPDNLRRVGTYLIRRHEAPWTVLALRALEEFRWTMRRIPSQLQGRVASLAALSMLVWLFEIWSLSIVMLAWDDGHNPVNGLFAFLSQTAQGGVLPQMLNSGSAGALAYLLATQVPLAVLAAFSGAYYLRSAARRSVVR